MPIGCIKIEVENLVQKMEEQRMSFEEIAQAIVLQLEEKEPSLLVRAESNGIHLATSAMAEAEWDIFIPIRRERMTRFECSECAVEFEADVQFVGEIVQCPGCSAELEVTNLDPPTVALAPQEDEDWGE